MINTPADGPYRLLQTLTGPMLVAANDLLVNAALALYGEYSGDELALLEALCEPGDLVVDVGAHIGCLTLALARRVGPHGRVVALEPQQHLFQLLTANMVINGITCAQTIQAGAGATESMLRVANDTHSILRNYGAGRLSESGGAEVAVRPLDSLKLDGCTVLKIDVEGMERDVLQGARRTIGPQTVVYLENSPYEAFGSLAASHALLSDLLEAGFALFWHTPRFISRRAIPPGTPDIFANGGSFNVLAVPRGVLSSERWARAPKDDLTPIAMADDLVFPLWYDTVLVRRATYDRARARGAAPVRPGDDAARPRLPLQGAFLHLLQAFAAERGLANPLATEPGLGAILAEIWFDEITRPEPGAERVIFVNCPEVLVQLAARYTDVVVAGARPGSVLDDIPVDSRPSLVVFRPLAGSPRATDAMLAELVRPLGANVRLCLLSAR